MKKYLLAAALAALVPASALAAPQRLLTPDDLYKMRDVSDPQIAPDGNWIAYAVRTVDAKADKRETHIWMTRFDGSQTVQLTNRPKESEGTPRFSPDGRWLAFTSGRMDDKKNDQLWLMNRAGGEAQKVTDLKGGVVDYAWSPDGKKIAVIATDPDPNDKDGKDDDDDKTQKPIVIDRYYFMEDVTGYLTHRRDHIYVLDVASKKIEQVTTGDYDDALPAWSPDSKSIAFASNRHPDADRVDNWDIYTVAARKGAQPKQITTYTGVDNAPGRFDTGSYPAWSPDGKYIAYWQGGEPRLIAYATNKLAIIPANGGQAKILTPSLDRNIGNVSWSNDSKSVLFSVEDDRTEYLARVSVDGGPVQHIAGGRDVIADFSHAKGRFALLISNPQMPYEVFAWDQKSAPRQITHNNDWLKDYKLASTQEIAFKSKDGTDVHGFLVKPPGGGAHLPTILRIHGGPQSQFADEFMMEWQVLAAHGYAVVAANPRGSTGRGTKYCSAIYADWGGPDVPDVLAAVDYAVKAGVADPNRLGVGGWSYGGMLTNYTIASDTRFKAATSGASISDILGGYGNDQYVHDYEVELGLPWKNTATWLKVSYPFLHADRIKTPTLFLGGDADMNVPLHNGEQMYQALKSMGIDSQLIVYPGQYHGLTVPSYLKDRWVRYLAWYDRHLKH
jgi:dipeptidyl aminopeptidase/acylaminoacyl peptidase